MQKLSAIIVNYNTQDLLVKCINNLIKEYPEISIVVRDNGSPDDSVKIFNQNYSSDTRISLIEGENVGIAKATNEALAMVNSQYILHLGTDAFPRRVDLEKLMDFMDKNLDVGMTTAKLLLRDGTVDWDAHRGFPTPWTAFTHFSGLGKLFPKSRMFNYYFLGHLQDDTTPHEIDVCISHFMLMRSEVYTDLLWDEDYFVFGEDVDICYRLKSEGWKLFYVPEVEVLHIKGVNVGRKTAGKLSTASYETKIRMKKASTEAFRIFYKKHYSEKYPRLITALVIFGITIMEIIRVRSVKK